MPSSEYDLRYLRAALPVLEVYLLSRDVYWSIGITPPRDESPYPQLTPGGILLAGRRLKVGTLSNPQYAELARMQDELGRLQSRWRKAWSQKASTEFNARLRLWRDFLEEYRIQPATHANRYPYEVTRRVLLQLLEAEATPLPDASLELLSSLDGLLRNSFIPGEFIWEDTLIGAFPQPSFWYLYGRLSS